MEKGNNEGKRQRKSNYERMHGEEKEKYNEREDNRSNCGGLEGYRWKEQDRYLIEGMKEKDSDAERGKKGGEGDDVLFPLVTGIHTIKEEDIILIENRKNQREKVERDRKNGLRLPCL